MITDYIEGKQTVSQLASKYGVNERTIRRDLASMRYVRKNIRGQTSRHSDGHHILGARLRPDGYQGCLEEENPLAQACDL